MNSGLDEGGDLPQRRGDAPGAASINLAQPRVHAGGGVDRLPLGVREARSGFVHPRAERGVRRCCSRQREFGIPLLRGQRGFGRLQSLGQRRGMLRMPLHLGARAFELSLMRALLIVEGLLQSRDVLIERRKAEMRGGGAVWP